MTAINRGAIATGNRLLDSLRDAPPPSVKGAKICIHPRKKTGGTAYRGTTGSTIDSIAQVSENCKQKAGYIVRKRNGISRFYYSAICSQ